MSSEVWAVVAGAGIGSITTLAGTWLTHHLDGRKQTRFNKTRKALLAKTLRGAGGDGWMNIRTLAQVVGADLDTTRALLIEIEARGSTKIDKEMWSLISRNPLPKEADD